MEDKVKLTKVEEEMLSGKCGNVIQKAMELLIAVGECYGAERMVPVASAHLPGCGSVVLGEAGIHYINRIAEEGGRFIIPTTTNPSSIDPWAWREMG